MGLPEVTSREAWTMARKDLLVEEKELTRRRDALNARRRRLPMVAVEKSYVFTGPAGDATLLELFEGARQLIVGHFMFDPAWEEGCTSCSAGAAEISPGLLDHLHARDTAYVSVSRALRAGEQPIEMPGASFFLREGDRVFHTYSTYARGAEMTGGSYYWLDLTALGRQEDWEEPKGRADTARGANPNFLD